MFFYRGNEMMAIRYGLYKAHYWTWTNGWEEFHVRLRKLVIQYITRVHKQLKKKMQISRGDWYYYKVFKL